MLTILLSGAPIALSAAADPSHLPPKGGEDNGAEIEIDGLIESLPNGLIGVWTVDGRLVEVNQNTELEEDDGPFEIGACVEVEGVLRSDGTVLAEEIETDDDCEDGGPDDGGPDDGGAEVEFFGALEQRTDALPGDWIVGGETVRVTAGTELENRRGPVALGACLKIEGERRGDGSILAREVEVRSAAGGCATRGSDDDDDAVELNGVVQESPDGDLGLWLISGRTVLVEETTELELPGGGSRVGLCVEVEGRFIDDGVVLASELEVEDDDDRCGAGPGRPAEVELEGRLEAFPGGDLTGDWLIGGVTVAVSPSTKLEEDDGLFTIGACVEATGQFLENGVLEARKVETEDDDCPGNDGPDGEIEFRDIVEEAPAGGLLGLWTIGFRSVEVDAGTEIDEDDGRLQLGACVKVEGSRREDGSIRAREVEVETASGSCVFPNGVVNAATLDDDAAVSPGEILTLFGLRLGPSDGAALEVEDGRVRSRVQGVRVWFDSTPAPILFARADQVNVVAPQSLAGKSSVQLQVEWRGAWSQPLRLAVREASPGLLTLSQSGAGQAAALNIEPGGGVSINGPENPAAQGRAVTLFGVGGGAFMGAFADGEVVGDDLPRPELPVRVTIGGLAAEVTYAGGAPGLVLGVLQINVIVPEGVEPGDAVPVTLEVGDVSSPSGVTLAIE